MQGTVEREYKSPQRAGAVAAIALTVTVVCELLVPVPAVFIITFIIAAAAFLRWQVRCSMNLQPLGAKKQRFSPSTGVVLWCVPVVNMLLPAAVVGEIWRRSHPNAKPGWEPGQPGAPKSPVIIAWWLTFTASRIIAYGTYGNENSVSSTTLLLYGVLTLAALMLVLILIWQISSNQERKHQDLARTTRTQQEYEGETRETEQRPRRVIR